MLTKRLIPCLDVKEGRVVKGINFEGLRDAGDPVEVAARYDQDGADEICFLDITASHEGRDTMLDVVERTASQCFCPLTVGGGIRSVEDVRRLLCAGADKISINSAAVKRPDLLAEAAQAFGSQCIVLAIDAKQWTPLQGANTNNLDSDAASMKLCNALGMSVREMMAWMHDINKRILDLPTVDKSATTFRGHVYIHGGRVDTHIDVIQWARLGVALGAGEILLTSMNADGTQQGYDLSLTRAVSEAVDTPVIASGGAGNLEHLAEALTKGKADAALAASIFHYQTHSLAQARAYLRAQGIPIRTVPGETIDRQAG